MLIVSPHPILTAHLIVENSKSSAITTLAQNVPMTSYYLQKRRNRIFLMWLSVVHDWPQTAFLAYSMLLILF